MIRTPYLLSGCFILLLHALSFSQQACKPVAKPANCSSFDLTSLPSELQTEARSTLQDLLDHEALYTLFSDLKPMSTGFWHARYPEAEGEPDSVQNMRKILATFHIANHISAGVLTFDKSHEGTRYTEGFVVNIPALKRLLHEQANFFHSLGLDIHSTPQEIIETVDRAEADLRFRGFGLLFGYPQHAINFFVTAHQQQQESGEFVKRDFFHVETFRKEKGAFVWAVPKGHIPNKEDLAIKKQANVVLTRYRQLRDLWLSNSLPLETLVTFWFETAPAYQPVQSTTLCKSRRHLLPISKDGIKVHSKLRRHRSS